MIPVVTIAQNNKHSMPMRRMVQMLAHLPESFGHVGAPGRGFWQTTHSAALGVIQSGLPSDDFFAAVGEGEQAEGNSGFVADLRNEDASSEGRHHSFSFHRS
jgi:hypothetical protein